jgi:acyl carrier protein
MMVDPKMMLAMALELDRTEIPDDASIENFEPWDSLGHMQLIATLEKHTGRPLETEEILTVMDLASIGELLIKEQDDSNLGET